MDRLEPESPGRLSSLLIRGGGPSRGPELAFAELSGFQKRSARAFYHARPRIRRNITATVRRFGGGFTQAEVDQVLDDVLDGRSTTWGGLMELGTVGTTLTPRQTNLLNTYINELPRTPLNERVRRGWNDWRRGNR